MGQYPRPVPASTLKVGDVMVFNPPEQEAEYAYRTVSLSGSAAHPVVGMIWIIRSGRRPRQSGLLDTEDDLAQ